MMIKRFGRLADVCFTNFSCNSGSAAALKKPLWKPWFGRASRSRSISAIESVPRKTRYKSWLRSTNRYCGRALVTELCMTSSSSTSSESMFASSNRKRDSSVVYAADARCAPSATWSHVHCVIAIAKMALATTSMVSAEGIVGVNSR